MPEYGKIVGLDVSLTDTGMAAILFDGKRWISAGQHNTGDEIGSYPDPLRQFEILKQVRGFVRMQQPDAVAIEDYSFGSHFGKSFTRAEMRGMLLHWLLTSYRVPVYLIAPLAIKKFMDCSEVKKRGLKEAMFNAASLRFRFVSANDNIVDAHCAARYLAANKEGQQLKLVRHDPLPQYREIFVQVPAPKKVSTDTKNRLLTTATGKPTLNPLPRRIRFNAFQPTE